MDRWSPRELREMLEERDKRKREKAAREERGLAIEERESRERFAPGGLEERKYLKGAETALAGTAAYKTRTAGMYGPEGYYTKSGEREEAKLPSELKDLMRGEKLSEILFPQRVAKAGYEAELLKETFEERKKAPEEKEEIAAPREPVGAETRRKEIGTRFWEEELMPRLMSLGFTEKYGFPIKKKEERVKRAPSWI